MLEIFQQVAHRRARIDDVLDDDEVLALDVVVEVLENLDGACRRRAVAIARCNHEIEMHGQVDGADEVRVEDGRALEDADAIDVFLRILVVLGDLRAEFRHLGLELFFRKVDLCDVVVHHDVFLISCSCLWFFLFLENDGPEPAVLFHDGDAGELDGLAALGMEKRQKRLRALKAHVLRVAERCEITAQHAPRDGVREL